VDKYGSFAEIPLSGPQQRDIVELEVRPIGLFSRQGLFLGLFCRQIWLIWDTPLSGSQQRDIVEREVRAIAAMKTDIKRGAMVLQKGGVVHGDMAVVVQHKGDAVEGDVAVVHVQRAII